MTGTRAIWLLLTLALAAMGGIVGMLLAEGTVDRVFFVMAASPLLVGAGYGWWLRWSAEAARTGRR